MTTVAQCLLSDRRPQVPIGAEESRPTDGDVQPEADYEPPQVTPLGNARELLARCCSGGE